MKLEQLTGLATIALIAMGGVASADAVYSGTLGAAVRLPRLHDHRDHLGHQRLADTIHSADDIAVYPVEPGHRDVGRRIPVNGDTHLSSRSSISSISFADGAPWAAAYMPAIPAASRCRPSAAMEMITPDPLNKYLVAEGGGGTCNDQLLKFANQFRLVMGHGGHSTRRL